MNWSRKKSIEFVCDVLNISPDELNERLKKRNVDCVYLNKDGRCWAIKGVCMPTHPKCSYRKEIKNEDKEGGR